MSKGNWKGLPAAIKFRTVKYNGPTVGERVEILTRQVAVLKKALLDIQQDSSEPETVKTAQKAVHDSAKTEMMWVAWHKEKI